MKKYLLSLFVSMLAVSGAWAQEIVSAETDDVEGAEVRRLDVVISGNWLDGANAEAMTNLLINTIMGYDEATGTFVDGAAYTEVTIKSKEGETVTLNQALVQQLVTGKAGYGADFGNGYALEKNKIERLDLSDVAVTHYVGHDGAASPNGNATLYARNGGSCPIKYFAMPSFDETVEGQTYSVPPFTIAWMDQLHDLILPKNAKTLETAAFAGVNVPIIKLNMGLEFIGNSAFYASSQVSEEATLDVPSSVKYIGPGAFNFRNFSDIYFHSAQAPICPTGKVYCSDKGEESTFLMFGNYTGWGGITYVANTENGGDNYKDNGVANRMNYNNQDSYWFTMIHFPASADVPNLDISSYKDDTRVYNKVYGSIYYDVNNDQGNLEIGVPGKEQEYIAREKVWAFQGSYDFVGQEEEVLSYDGMATSLAGSGYAAIPAEAVGKGVVDSGFEDTYRGLNYIWPCQAQYNRAYATVANGFNWDGVTPYRPDITLEQYLLMAKDGLEFKATDGTMISIASMFYTDASAAEYNAGLDGAIHAGEVKETYTQEEADAYNESLMVHEGDPIYYTEQEVIDFNAALDVPGAVHEGDFKETKYYTYEEWLLVAPDWVASAGWTKEKYEASVENAKTNPYEYFPAPYKVDVYYTKEEAAAANADLEGAISTSDVKYYLTAEQAAEINANNPNLVNAGDPKSYYTEAEALAHNAGLDDAVKFGDPVEGAPDYTDEFSKIAFQGTRRCVFADNAGGGDYYDTHVPTSKAWWTICLPFDLTKDQIDKYFGKGTHVCLFNKVDREIKQLPEKSILKFYFTDDQYSKAAKGNDVVLQAHVPYMIFPTKEGENGTEASIAKIPMSEYSTKPGSPEPTIVKANDYAEYAGTDHTEYRFVGNYDTKLPIVAEDGSVTTTDVVVPQYSYIYAKKSTATGKHPYQFWFTQNGNIKWAPNKCVIQSTAADRGLQDQETFFKIVENGVNPEDQVKQMTILLGDEIDDDANEIEVVFIAGDGENSEVIYNLNGQMIRTAPQNGVYIKNGKKYIAR
ncbi:MAG: leucine-rich repeat domain-containing protein [Bacteroidaceae bacterium]|nr:leucine-rich repeat domain-containing protein [Bacteroidaceae bacterium]